MAGLSPIKALFFEFLDEPGLFAVDRQWLVGSDSLLTPVLTPGPTSVDGIFLGRGSVIWRDWYTHAAVIATSGGNTTLDAPISHINVHIRDDSTILLHQEPGYTIYETREDPYALLVSLSAAGTAFGTAYVGDGISFPPGPSRNLTFQAAPGTPKIESEGEYVIQQIGDNYCAQGAGACSGHPSMTDSEGVEFRGELVVSNASISLNGQVTLACQWK